VSIVAQQIDGAGLGISSTEGLNKHTCEETEPLTHKPRTLSRCERSSSFAAGRAVIHLEKVFRLHFGTNLTFRSYAECLTAQLYYIFLETAQLQTWSLGSGHICRGGFFTDSATATSLVNDANFVYLGLSGFTVQFDGFVTESMADFGGGTVLDGSVLQFRIADAGTIIGSRNDLDLDADASEFFSPASQPVPHVPKLPTLAKDDVGISEVI
jgi:hypothetical protein